MRISTIVAGATIALSAFTAGAATHGFGSNPLNHRCANEGTNNCYWDAAHQGNHRGRSYIVTKAGNVFTFDAELSTYPKSPFHK